MDVATGKRRLMVQGVHARQLWVICSKKFVGWQMIANNKMDDDSLSRGRNPITGVTTGRRLALDGAGQLALHAVSRR
jgi:hypothetical protein